MVVADESQPRLGKSQRVQGLQRGCGFWNSETRQQASLDVSSGRSLRSDQQLSHFDVSGHIVDIAARDWKLGAVDAQGSLKTGFVSQVDPDNLIPSGHHFGDLPIAQGQRIAHDFELVGIDELIATTFPQGREDVALGYPAVTRLAKSHGIGEEVDRPVEQPKQRAGRFDPQPRGPSERALP